VSPPEPETPAPGAIVLRALLYALAIVALVLFAPSDGRVFLYQGF
jgi:hypothetical protein